MFRICRKDEKNKRTLFACFIRGVYLLELDRQEKRTENNNALAPNWWIPFKYKLADTIVDQRDGSIFGAILEWDWSAALADLVFITPSGAPQAVLALRGTLLKSPTIRRDIEDDLRFLAWESLKGSVRFNVILEALKSVVERYGSSNVCIAGHSLGAGFALQVGKALAKKGIIVEAHLFNPPSVSLPMSIKDFGERAESVWNKFISIFSSINTDQESIDKSDDTPESSFKSCIPNFDGQKAMPEVQKWVPHLYVNNNDYICCYYADPDGGTVHKNAGGNKTFLKLMDWSDDVQLKRALHSSKLISRQLKSLYSMPSTIPK